MEDQGDGLVVKVLGECRTWVFTPKHPRTSWTWWRAPVTPVLRGGVKNILEAHQIADLTEIETRVSEKPFQETVWRSIEMDILTSNSGLHMCLHRRGPAHTCIQHTHTYITHIAQMGFRASRNPGWAGVVSLGSFHVAGVIWGTDWGQSVQLQTHMADTLGLAATGLILHHVDLSTRLSEALITW